MLTDRIHYFGGLACAQMTMGFGRQGHSRDEHMLGPGPHSRPSLRDRPGIGTVTGHRRPCRRARKRRGFMVGQMTREMTISEIHSEQKEFARSCQIAVVVRF